MCSGVRGLCMPKSSDNRNNCAFQAGELAVPRQKCLEDLCRVMKYHSILASCLLYLRDVPCFVEAPEYLFLISRPTTELRWGHFPPMSYRCFSTRSKIANAPESYFYLVE